MRENSIHKAFTFLGAQDIEAGIEDFDAAFIIKAQNIGLARQKLQTDLCARTRRFKQTGFGNLD